MIEIPADLCGSILERHINNDGDLRLDAFLDNRCHGIGDLGNQLGSVRF